MDANNLNNHDFFIEPVDIEIAEFVRTIALPIRVSLIRLLLANEWIHLTELLKLPMTRQSIERHIKALTYANLVLKKRGDLYKLNTPIFQKHCTSFNLVFNASKIADSDIGFDVFQQVE